MVLVIEYGTYVYEVLLVRQLACVECWQGAVVFECWTYMGCWDPLMLTLWHLPRVCFSTTGVCSTVYFSPYNIVRDGGQGGIEVLKWCYILYIAVWCLGSRLQLTFSHHFVLNSSAQRHIIKVMSMMTA